MSAILNPYRCGFTSPAIFRLPGRKPELQRNNEFLGTGSSSGNPDTENPGSFIPAQRGSSGGTSGGDYWVNVKGEPLKMPTYQFGNPHAYDAMVCDTLTWTGFTLGGIVTTLGGYWVKINELFGKMPTAAIVDTAKAIGWWSGFIWFFSAMFGVIAGSIMMTKNSKEARKKATQFFDSLKTLFSNDEALRVYCNDVFCPQLAWAGINAKFWITAEKIAKGMAATDGDGKPITPAQAADLWREGLSDMFDQHSDIAQMLDMMHSNAKLKAALDAYVQDPAKNPWTAKDDELLQTSDAELRNWFLKKSGEDYFGALTGGIPAFRAKGLDVFKAITGEISAANGSRNKFFQIMSSLINDPLASPVGRGKALEFKTKMEEYATGLGFADRVSQSRLEYTKLMYYVGFGTADQIWNEAAILYGNVTGLNGPVADNLGIQLPDYNFLMNIWATRNSDEAKKNMERYNGQRFPPAPMKAPAAH